MGWRWRMRLNLAQIAVFISCGACSSESDERNCERIVQNGITAMIEGQPFAVRCGVALPGGHESIATLYAKAPQGMTVQLSSDAIDCSSNLSTQSWPLGKHVSTSVWAREPGTYDGAEAMIWTLAGNHGTGYPDLSSTTVIDAVTESTVQGSIDINYHTTTSAIGTFEVKRCF